MYCLGVLLLVLALAYAKRGPCYSLGGNVCLEYRPPNFNNSHNIHYQLQFETTTANGILLYSEGPDDYEALFVSQGKLIYLLTNPSPSGVEGTSGGLYVSDAQVNNGTWLTVDVWRNWEKRGRGHRDTVLQTGMAIRDDSKNSVETHVDHFLHRGVRLHPVVYYGGIKPFLVHTQGGAMQGFVGRVRHLYEERNGESFANPSVSVGRENAAKC